MKIAIFAILSACCLATIAADFETPGKQPKITCDLFGSVFGNVLCYAHCVADGFKRGGQCNSNMQCVCNNIPPGFDYCQTPTLNLETKFTCDVIGGIIGVAACNVHCTLHGCDMGLCLNKKCNCRNFEKK